MRTRALTTVAATVALLLGGAAFAATPFANLLPQTTVLAVEVDGSYLDPAVLAGLVAGVDWSDAKGVIARLTDELRPLLDDGATRTGPGAHHWRDAVIPERCDRLADVARSLHGSASGPAVSLAVAVNVPRFAGGVEPVLIVRAGSLARSANLLAGAVACFDARRHGEQGASAIYKVDASGVDLFLAEHAGDVFVSPGADLLRSVLRRAQGSNEPSFADTDAAAVASELAPGGLKVTLNALPAANSLERFMVVVPGEAKPAVARALTTLRALGSHAWAAELTEGGVRFAAAQSWDRAALEAAGEATLLRVLDCDGCSVAAPPYFPTTTVAFAAGSLPVAALADYLDGWIADLAGVSGVRYESGTVPSLRGLAAEELGVDLDALLLGWWSGEWYSYTLDVLGTDLAGWVGGLPTALVLPVTSEPAAFEAVRAWLGGVAVASRQYSRRGAPDFSEVVAVSEESVGGVQFLRVRAPLSVDVAFAVADGNLVIASPSSVLGEVLASRGANATGTVANGVRMVLAGPERTIGYSVVDGARFVRGAAELAELLSGPAATALWAAASEGAYPPATARLGRGAHPEAGAFGPTYADVLALTDLPAAVLNAVADGLGTAVGSVTVTGDALRFEVSVPFVR